MPAAGFRRFASALEAGARARGMALAVHESVGSTNDLARRAMASGPPAAPVAFVAWRQDRGRGRAGRRWESPAGSGLYATILAPELDQGRLQLLPLATAIAVVDAVAPMVKAPLGIKWPNDLVIGGAKLGGILVEAVSRGPRTAALVGIGLNVGPTLPPVRDRSVTTVAAHAAQPVSLADVGLAVLEAALAPLERPPAGGTVVSRLIELSTARPGDELEVLVGGRPKRGVLEGFDEKGRLVLATKLGIERLAAAEVVGP